LSTVLITGASRGIGRALCEEALRRGYTVHATTRKAGTAPAGVTEHVVDVREREKIKGLLTRLAPELDFYIANAGIDHNFKPKEDDCAEKGAEVFEVNGTATAYSLFLLAHEWVKAGASGKRMAVVSSLASGRGVPRNGAYVATKTAELVLAQSLERDLARRGIGVSVIQPGFIDTELSSGQPQRPFLMSAPNAARVIWNGLERGKYRIAFPKPAMLAMAFMNALPYCVYRAIVMAMQKARML
jgi:NAD(P)-dependent dehydrogenase (short-subunit alcohol dehydrogenase family)